MRKPPGFRGEEVCAEECNQPDKHENSQAHLPDLRGSWDSHTAAQANLRMAQKFITFSIANFQMPIASWMLPKSASAEGRYSVNLRAAGVNSKNARQVHRSRPLPPLRLPAEELLLRLRSEQS